MSWSSYSLNTYLSKTPHNIEEVEKKLKTFKTFTTKDITRLIGDGWALLEEVAEALETITISSSFNIYVVKEKSNTLHQWVNGRMSYIHYDIKPGSILAAYSAYTKKLQVADSQTSDNCFPLGIGRNTETHVLSLPVVTPNDIVLAVIDLYRDLNGEKFSEEDLLIGLTITNWLGAAYAKYSCSQKILKENNLHQTMFKILTDFFKVNGDIDNLIDSIAMFIKNKMKISRFKFYRFVKDRQHWAYLYNEVKPNKLVRSEKAIRVNNSSGLIAIVLKEPQNLNLNTNDLDDQYSSYLAKLKSDAIDYILLVPIIRRGFVLGVMELINKLNGKAFTKGDEDFLENVSKYYSLALHCTNVLLKHKRVKEQLKDGKKLLLFMLEPCEHDFNEVMDLWSNTKLKPVPKYLMSFSYYPWQAEELEIIEQTLIIFNHAIKDVFENDENMIRFVMMSKKMYRKNHYHNYEHAFNVMHFVVNIRETVRPVLTELEWKAIVIGAFCHDMDHPGITNNFLKATSHCLVELYQESVLENHHSYVAHLLITELNLFAKFSKEEYKFIMNEIHEIIIATDLAVYFKQSQVITSIITNNSFSWFNVEHMRLLKNLMITTSDLSGQWKPCEITVKVTMNLYREFYLQGDREKALGLKPISMMDRDLKKAVPTDQLNFIMLICVPCADMLLKFLPQLFPIFTHVLDVLNYWLDQKRKLGFRNKDEEVEDEARMSRVHESISNIRYRSNMF
ncbi:cAMP and cAMP-inhibited cGMP 3',5'-cyclic phosphodiesterase 10A [Halyomorpha halys]|uniref:cAMP and cAMP-inhibited cGMP 3',5'-cyclic phosphodiesterase 10A n=1 Tax=Halyomorpha halys TaxID=286706 RepID=UPI0006D4EBA4|nr:cAMP and cAMP-inhibited cGMP 3',5'-cyclic phosphodiesterase 10A-like [Halyomorpha halys]